MDTFGFSGNHPSAPTQRIEVQDAKGRAISVPSTGQKSNAKRKRSPHPKTPIKLQPWQTGLAKPSPLRLWLVWVVLVVGSCGLLMQLYRLQVMGESNTIKLKPYADHQQRMSTEGFIPRRVIQDNRGNILALDRKTYEVYVHPVNFTTTPEKLAEALSPILQRTPEDLLKAFSKGKSGIRIERAVTQEIGDRILGLGFNGIELIGQQERYYPQGDLFGDVMGFVNLENQGQTGLEQSQQQLLRYFRPKLTLTQTGDGLALPNDAPIGAFKQDDRHLQLTLDSRLQRAAREALKAQIQKFGATRGTVIVMDASDGALLALANEPTYNPNEYYKAKVEQFKNWALSDRYEPGSTFKPINVAIALESGKVSPDAVYSDGGQIGIGVHVIGNVGNVAHGAVSIPKILQVSSNIGMIQIMRNLPAKEYYTWLERLGLNGKSIAVDLPSDMAGYLKDKDTFLGDPVEPAVTAFGQGFSLTPLKLVQLHGTLANGGKLVTPHVMKALVNANGQPVGDQPQVPPPQRVFSEKTAKTVVEMMETVVTSGSGQPAQIPGYRIGGKTGTAQKANPNGGYSNSAKICSFVSILPINKPRYVVAVIVDEPQGGNTFGSTVAAPVAKQVMESLVVLRGMPPTGKAEAVVP
jgi:cell division protein FtsI (penicillin-binding protein 3)